MANAEPMTREENRRIVDEQLRHICSFYERLREESRKKEEKEQPK